MAFALGKACSQACSQVVTLPSVMAIALGKVTENSLFYLFFTSHPNKPKIYITNITNITYISSTAHIYHQHHIYISQTSHIYHKRHMSHNISQISSQVVLVLRYKDVSFLIPPPTIFVQSPVIKKSKPINIDKQEVLRKRCKINKT